MSKVKEIITKYSREEFKELYIKCKTIKSLANELNVSDKTISRVLKEFNIPRLQNLGNKKHNCNESFFEVIDTEEKAYWLGFIYADGCVYQGTGKTYRFQINLKDSDDGHLNKLNKSLDSDYKLTYYTVNNYKAVSLKINSTKMCKDLIKLGVTERKSNTILFPQCIPDDLIRHFIRGYFDGDGCVSMSINNNFKKSFMVCSGSESFIDSICNILNIQKYIKDNVIVASTSDTNKICDIYKFLYDNATIYLGRKKYAFDILNLVLTSPIVK